MNTSRPEPTPRGVKIQRKDPPPTPRRIEKHPGGKPKKALSDEDKETINSLKREQERLTEELEEEKQQSEKMKNLYTGDLNYYIGLQKQAFIKIKNLLSKANQDDPHVAEALKLLGVYDQQETGFIPDTPRVAHLAEEAREAEMAADKHKRENRNLKQAYKQLCQELHELDDKIADAESRLEVVTNKRKETHTTLHNFIEKCKQREAAWKEKVASLEAKIEAQG